MIASSVPASISAPTFGVVPTSVAIPQQSVPVFRQPLGVHIPHFPTNYLPYNQYISPFFIPSPTLQPFMGNAAFPQPPTTGAMYPAPGSAGILPPVKYSLPSFKSGPNTGSQASIGLSGGYGTYGSSPSVYTNTTTVSSGNPAENDDVTSSQVKENSIYIAGLQVWFCLYVEKYDILTCHYLIYLEDNFLEVLRHFLFFTSVIGHHI